MKTYLEFNPAHDEAKHLAAVGFKAQIADAYEMENGFVAVRVDWSSEVDSCKFKYASQGSKISSSDKIIGVELVFEGFPYKPENYNYEAYPSILVQLDYKSSDKKMDFVCFHNLKYEAVVYFAPQTWNLSRKIKKIKF